jgi:hypothetical protein
MSSEEFSRSEWAMYLDIPARDRNREVLPCFCYELTRDWIRDAQKRKPDVVWDSPVWGNWFAADFANPYLDLDPKGQIKVANIFPSYYNIGLDDLAKRNLPARKMAREVEFWLSVNKGATKEGRAALAAKLRQCLRYLGAYRILQKYRWNNMPRGVPDIQFYINRREWDRAEENAKWLIRSWFLICLSLTKSPRWKK